MIDAQLSGIKGSIDSLDQFNIGGWLYSPLHTDANLTVQIIVDNVVLAELPASTYRDDLTEAGIGNGNHAFQFEMPRELFDGRSHFVDVVVPNSDFKFPNVPCEVFFTVPDVQETAAPSSVKGISDLVRSTSKGGSRIHFGLDIEGWYTDDEKPDHVFKVEAIENGKVLTTASTTRKSSFGPYAQSRSSGYLLTLPPELLDGRAHEINFAFDGTVDAQSAVIFDGKQTGIGFVDRIGAKLVSGWAASFSNLSQPVVVEVLCNGVSYGRGTANIFREDLTSIGSITGFQGFSISLNKTLFKDDLDHVSIQIADSKLPLLWAGNVKPLALEELERKPLQPRLKGFIDNVKINGVAGWAYDIDDPARRIRVNLSIEGCKIGGVIADSARTDLAKAFGTDGRHGFHIGFPPMLGLEGIVNVEASFAETGHLIGKKQIEFRAATKSRTKNENSGLQRYLYTAPAMEIGEAVPLVNVIVLNRNGSDHLDTLFKSFHTFNAYPNYIITVIDHGSTDASAQTAEHWQNRLNINFIDRGRNYGFSHSNNFGANLTGDYFLFLNNDIILVQCILSEMVKLLRDEAVGVVGIKLRSPPNDDEQAFHSEGFIQHLGVKFGASSVENTIGAYELPLHPDTLAVSNSLWKVPAVTAAAMMMRKGDFAAVGGFEERYFYGYEDVDLCLKVTSQLGKSILCANNIVALHYRGATRTNEDEHTRLRYASNLNLLKSRFGARIRQQIRREALEGERFSRFEALKVAFLVSTTDMAAPEADFFTAFELGEELAALKSWSVTYVPPQGWYDLADFDVVIAMRQDWDPNKITSSNSNLLKVAWARNWFDRWLVLPWLDNFDIIWAASNKSASAFRANTKKPVEVFRIATSAQRFQNSEMTKEYLSDYCFTGSFFKAPREIVCVLDPDALPYSFNLFGHNWGEFPRLSKYWRGSLPYLDMPKVYGSVKVVIDDCNSTVKEWGSVNSRVFDALAAGVLVISNGRVGSDEVFNGDLPVYEGKQNFTDLLNLYLSDDVTRLSLVDKLRQKVLSEHTYARRAEQAARSLGRVFGQLRLNVRFDQDDIASEIIARIIADCLREQGFWLRMESISKSRKTVERNGDDIVLWVTAKSAPKLELMPDQVNVLVHLTTGAITSVDDFDMLILGDAVGSLEHIPKPKIFLFESQSERERAFGLDSGDFVFKDGRVLRDAIAKHTSKIVETINGINRTKIDGPSASTSFSSLLDEVETNYGLHLVIYPDYRNTNPYQRLLYKDLPPGYDVEFGDIAKALDNQIKRKGKPTVFHLHWTSPILGVEQSPQVAEMRLEKFVLSLETFINAGGHLAWTIHNTLPHEMRHPELEVRLCKKLAELASTIHIHSLGVPTFAAEHYELPVEKTVLGAHGNYIGTYADFIDKTAARSRLGLAEDNVVFLFLGQLRSYKGIENLVSAFQTINNPNARLLIVGSPVNMSMNGLRESIRLDKRMQLVEEHVADDDLQIYMRSADFAVLPYDRVLTSGSVYLALSFGVPVIASDGGLIPEMITDGSNGLLFRNGDVASLQAVLQKSLDLSPVTRKELAAGALASAEACDWTATLTTLLRSFMATTISPAITLQVGTEKRRTFIKHASAPSTHARVAAVVLHYNDLGDTVRCVDTLLAQAGTPPHIYIVSNDLNAISFAYLSEKFPDCTVIQCDDNLGYAGGNNVALALITERDFDYMWIVNPDTVVPVDFLQRMTVLADTNSDTAIFGSKILFGDRPDIIWFGGGEISWKNGFESKHRYIGKRSGEMPAVPVSCDYITGASIFFRKEVIDRIGLIPEQYFLYFEETDWCLMAAKAGIQMKVFPETELLHHKRSEDGGAPTPVFLYYYCRNALILCAKFHADVIAETHVRLLETASIWKERIGANRSDMVDLSNFAIELGLQHGLAGVTGRIDLAREFGKSVNKTRSFRQSASD
ncbi:glycosyltransferase [Rhizobium sp. Root483D2]|uniref:glycosyltransferase family protein n=1 Tax=Rhizobium sp. Root483D2 TaxID=1736545 RepID=UPI000713E0AA|nr:glycosyltransferase [Rhizobium sp. Root483D2]KQY45714.1 hypothetical protein ASD32_10905 [Rhizobium sp. Root483D2]